MAIVPNDPRQPDYTASDILSAQVWPRRSLSPAVGLDVICIKIAVDFQSMSAADAAMRLGANLELLREATRADTAFHIALDPETTAFTDVAAAHGLLATGNHEQLRGLSLDALPWFRSRLAPLRVSELRDTAKARGDQAVDAALWCDLGIGSVLMIAYYIEGRPAGALGIAGARPREQWDVQLHLLLKLVGSSLAIGLERIAIQARLSDLEERNELALSSANDGLWDFDTLNNRVYLSPRWKAMLGYDESQVGQAPDWRTLVHTDDMSRVQAAIRDHVAGKTPLFESMHRMRHATGEWRWVISRAKARVDENGRLIRLVGVELDITERKLYEEALFREKESAQITLQSIGDGVVTTDAHGVIDYINPVAEQLTGWRLEDSQGRAIEEVFRAFHEETCEPLENPLSVAIRRTRSIKSVRPMLLIRRDGNEIYVESTASPIRDGSGAVSGGVLVFHDVSEARELNRRLSYHASHDVLTGLVNRREFEHRMERALKSAKAHETSYALCYLDLDQFKLVNDTCGHSAGDNMLREVASLIKDAVRDSDTVGRIGGDEFALLLVGCPLEKARQIADDVVRSVNDYRFVWKDKIFNIGVSVGLVEIGRDGATIEDIINSADSACYVAKKQGGVHVHVYSAREEASARHRGEIHWLQKLQAALRDNAFELYIQPIVHAQRGGERGPALEVFVRLKAENGVPGTPTSEFIRAAERYRLMPHIDRWVVQAVLSALGRGGLKLPAGRSIAINLAGQTLGDVDFLEYVVDCFDHTGAAPGDICFEVTESAVVANMDHARRFIEVLHGMGCEFALDNFGSGLSSFSNLKTLPMDYLKIDGSFIHNLAGDSVNQALVAAMIDLSRTLNFRVVAEHVEDQRSLDTVKRMGIDFVQGFIVGRPQPLSLMPVPL